MTKVTELKKSLILRKNALLKEYEETDIERERVAFLVEDWEGKAKNQAHMDDKIQALFKQIEKLDEKIKSIEVNSKPNKLTLVIAFLFVFAFSTQANAALTFQDVINNIKIAEPLVWGDKEVTYDDIEKVFYSNDKPYVLDSVNYNMPNYWAKPSQFRAISGDCEDAAIYWAWEIAKIGKAKLELLISNNHVVLRVNDKWILDTLHRYPYKAESLRMKVIDSVRIV